MKEPPSSTAPKLEKECLAVLTFFIEASNRLAAAPRTPKTNSSERRGARCRQSGSINSSRQRHLEAKGELHATIKGATVRKGSMKCRMKRNETADESDLQS